MTAPQQFLLANYILRKRRKKAHHQRSIYMRQVNQLRLQEGAHQTLVREMMLADHSLFYHSFRMSPSQFESLLTMVAPKIHHHKTHAFPLSEEERLSMKLRYLATGNDQQSIALHYRVCKSTISGIIQETTDAIWQSLKDSSMVAPSTPDEWKSISKGFSERWNFPNCIGALAGKHVVIQCPSLSGSTYFNYKHSFSINLRATCDANYFFTTLDIGSPGRNADGGVFSSSAFGRALQRECLGLPPSTHLPGSDDDMPFVIIADEAFPLQQHILRHPGQMLEERKLVFNYRLSRARRTIENTFGILAARWRIFRRAINAKTTKVISIAKACALHNWLKGADRRVPREFQHYCPVDYVDKDTDDGTIPGKWRKEVDDAGGLRNVQCMGSNNYSTDSAAIRERFCHYFTSDAGQVPWQYAHVRRGSEVLGSQIGP